MATQIKLRRGTTAQNNAFVGAEGEVTVDTDKDTLVVHNGVAAGGFPLAKAGANTDITSLSGLTTPLSVAQGGTGAATNAGTAYALKGANTDITSLTGLGAGTALLPTITPTGDTNTGVWFPAADTTAISTGGTERMRIDASGNVLVTSAAGLGYGTGAGGSVTQATSKSTAVTLNKPCGAIVTHAASLAAGASVRFDVLNSLVANEDAIVVNVLNSISYRVSAYKYPTIFGVELINITGGALAENVSISFAIIKGVTA